MPKKKKDWGEQIGGGEEKETEEVQAHRVQLGKQVLEGKAADVGDDGSCIDPFLSPRGTAAVTDAFGRCIFECVAQMASKREKEKDT